MTDQPEPTQDDIAQGARLSVILRPDHEILGIPTPTYNENYSLPFIYCDNGYYTGVTRAAHAVLLPDGKTQLIGFGYTNAVPYYSIFTPNSIGDKGTPDGQILSRGLHAGQYDYLRFTALPAGKLLLTVDDSGRGDPEPVRESIATGHKHYAVVDFGEGRLRSAPIDISYDFFTTGRFEFRTEAIFISAHLSEPKQFRTELLEAAQKNDALLTNKKISFTKFFTHTWTFLHLFDDGTYLDVPQELGTSRRNYVSLRIYEYP